MTTAQTCLTLNGLNHDIIELEVEQINKYAKNSKCVWLDNLTNEILKNQATIEVLVILFQKIFTSSIVPTIWKTGIIKPIPKSSLLDPRVIIIK